MNHNQNSSGPVFSPEKNFIPIPIYSHLVLLMIFQSNEYSIIIDVDSKGVGSVVSGMNIWTDFTVKFKIDFASDNGAW